MAWILFALSPLPMAIGLQICLRQFGFANRVPLQKQTALLLVVLSLSYAVLHFKISAHYAADSRASATLFMSLLSVCSAYCYFHLLNMAHTARRIQLLVGGPAPYNTQEMIEHRLERLVALQIVERNRGEITMRPNTLLWVAKGIGSWRSLIFPNR